MPLPTPAPKPDTLAESHALIEALWAEVNALRPLRDVVSQLEAKVAEQQAQIQELSDRLGKSSRNSSLPPSSDSVAQRAKRKKRPRSNRQQGAQPGHKGHQRDLLDESAVDEVHQYFPSGQCDCGAAIAIEADPSHRHQVFDLPPVQYTVTEHQIFDGVCRGCGKKHKGAWPRWISSGQMGPGLIAWIVLMAGQFHLSIRQIQALLREQWQLDFSIGAISQAQGKALPWLARHYQDIGEHVRSQSVVHADETRYFLGAEARWLWAMATDSALYLMAHYSRGKAAAKALLDGYGGVLVTDHYPGYNDHDRRRRQLCWAHLIRHFTAMSERAGSAGTVGTRLLRAAQLVIHVRHRFDRGEIEYDRYRRRIERLRSYFCRWLEIGALGAADNRTTRQCRHLLRDVSMCWTFMDDLRIPLTNNTAERGLRQYVIWRKLSYAVQSGRGECFVPMVLSVIGTAQSLGISTYQLLRQSSAEYVATGRVSTAMPLGRTRLA